MAQTRALGSILAGLLAVSLFAAIGAAQGLPDLAPTALTMNPAEPEAGHDIQFSATIENLGDAASGNFTVRFLLDGNRSLGNRSVGGLAPGASANVTSDLYRNATAGNHTIRVIADSANQVSESDEGNNERALAFTVTGTDLRAGDLEREPDPTRPGDIVHWTLTVENTGTEDVGAFTVRFSLNENVSLGDRRIESLAAGASVDVMSDAWEATEALDHELVADVDVLDEVNESREDNNRKADFFRAAWPDHKVRDLDADPAGPTEGDAVVFTAEIFNEGAGESEEFTLRFLVDGMTLSEHRINLAPRNIQYIDSAPWTAIAGDHRVRAVVDALDEVRESNETNNELEIDVHVAMGPRPDLVVRDIILEPAAPHAGDSVTFRAQVKNQGDAAAAASTLRFRLDGELLGEEATAALEPGQWTNVTSDAWNATQGNHTIEGIADASDDVEESNETNNARSESFTVAGPRQADLRVPSLTRPEGARHGDAVTFTATIRNGGNGAAGAFHVRFLIDNATVVSEHEVEALDAGASVNVTSDAWTAVEGHHSITAIADSLDEVNESDEANNRRSRGFDVAPPPRPDLRPSQLRASQLAIRPGDVVTFRANVTNHNNESLSAGPFTVRFLLDGNTTNATNLGDRRVESLGDGETILIESDGWTAIEGDHIVTVIVDVDDEVAESNEANNEKSITVEVGRPDLIGVRARFDGAQPREGESRRVVLDVKNCGDAPAYDWRIRYYMDGEEIGSRDAGGLEDHCAVIGYIGPLWTATAGTHTLRAVADADGTEEETNETNNEASLTFTVAPRFKPDLVIADIEADPDAPREGDNLTFRARIRNDGNASAGAFTVRFKLDGELLSDHRVDGLAEGANVSVASAVWLAKEGQHSIEAFADALEEVDEWDEANNNRSEQVPVGPPRRPDLVPAQLAVHPAQPIEGETVHLTAVARNDGEAAAGPFLVRFLIDNATLSEHAIAGLPVGESANLTSANWTALPGAHTASVVVDALDEVRESNETNNGADRSFFVDHYEVDLSPENQSKDVLPMGMALYSIQVTNTGTLADTVRLALSAPPRGWQAQLDRDAVELEPGQSTQVLLRVTAPLALEGQARVDVTGTSDGNPARSDTVSTLTTIRVV